MLDLINKLKKHKQQLENIDNKKSETNITISKMGNIYKMEINDYISIIDYVEKMEQIDNYNLKDIIYNAILWNSRKQCVNKGTFYAIADKDKTYNILLDEDIIEIDERTKKENIIEEKFIFYDQSNDNYRYSSLKCYSDGNTFYTKYYSKNSENIYKLELPKEQAYEEIESVILNLGNIENIENVLNLDILNNILQDINPKQLKKIK